MFKNKQENMAVQDPSNSNNNIGKGTIIEGNIETYGNIRIEGKVNGSVKSKSKIVLGQSSYVDGNIVAQNAELSGEVKGVVEVSDQLILKPTAVIAGDIVTNKLIVESGATFNGGCKMGIAQKEIKIGGANGQTKPFEAKTPTTPESKSN
jgi:cytoskeletal protein CcmA (bactofilin family)